MKHLSLILFIWSIAFRPLLAQCPQLIWSDEFNGNNLDQSKWSYEIGDGCNIGLCQWGNNELQWYTSNEDNVSVSAGTLKITALKQTIQNRSYSSGRIKSLLKGDFKYGRLEARIKMPKGQGIWPAWWMLPTDMTYGVWPQSGELDIVEYLGHEPNKVHATLHFGRPWPNNASTTKNFVIQLGDFTDFHDYALEWTDQDIKWFVDGYLYAIKTRSDLGSNRWPFDQRFHFLLNLAVGGNWPGNPNSSTIFPQQLEVDYVRAYDMVGQPFLEGPNQNLPGQKSVTYALKNVPTGSTIEWTLPEGVTLKSGQNTSNIIVDWGNTGGKIMAKLKNVCGEFTFTLATSLLPILSRDIILENYDVTPRIKKTSSTGGLTVNVNNPVANSVNNSNLCGRYIRNAGSQFDVLIYDIEDVKFASDFVTGEKKFYIDILTAAPVGTEILLQLEDKNQAQASNYPLGRHSRYVVKTTKQNEWERLSFTFLDRPSTAVSDFSINQVILLFASNTFTGATYFIDNFEIYSKTTVALQQEVKDRFIKIYPNPSSKELNIKALTDAPIRRIRIVNLHGQLMDSLDGYQSSHIVWKTTNLSPGMYVILLSLTSGRELSYEFIKN